ncbi:MAG: dimethyl sulfoxide reductase anchor subunit [Coriobacteriaceae bacterium]|jgi:anaerobic dimethyl sulfoxide reductase subunit C (anchor subunit)/Tat-targeted selenate reductase subunit YnfH|nr:dimethyl sulfoxide reductase anchor subunit [Coriobacteriaceae bacterium]
MEHAYAELPLAAFSTLASIGAGVFVALALAIPGGLFSSSPEKLKKIDRLTAIPVLLVGVGFIAAMFHLATPLNALNALNGVGRSPLTNEVVVGLAFMVVALAYWVAALTGRLGLGVRKALVSVLAVLAVFFAGFIGLAYAIPTIPTWNTPFAPASMLGYCLLGGSLFGLLILQAADVLRDVASGSFKVLFVALGLLGAAAAVIGTLGLFMVAGGIEAAGHQVAAALPWLVGSIAGLVLSLALAVISVVRVPRLGVVALGCLVVLCSVFVGRLVFYALYITVGV